VGIWKISHEGLALLKDHAEPFSDELVQRLAGSNNNQEATLASAQGPEQANRDIDLTGKIVMATVSPDERLDQALAEIRQSAEIELLELLGPRFSELLRNRGSRSLAPYGLRSKPG